MIKLMNSNVNNRFQLVCRMKGMVFDIVLEDIIMRANRAMQKNTGYLLFRKGGLARRSQFN